MKIGKSFPPALLITFNLFLFGPFLIFSANSSEFLVSFFAVMNFYILPAASCLSLLILIPVFLSDRPFKIYVALLFSLGLMLWLQGNLLAWNYGSLKGQFIDWHSFYWRAVIDVSVWIITFCLCVFPYKRLFNHVPFFSITLILIQLIPAIYAGFRHNSFSRSHDSAELATVPAGMYHFSSSRNVIHLVLDGFQSDIFQDIIDKNPQMRDKLSGFTFFCQATASYSNTFLSVPSFLSSDLFMNQGSIQDYMSRGLNGMNIPNALYAQGYRLDIATGPWWNSKTEKFANHYQIPNPYVGSRWEYAKSSATFLLDLALFRESPQPVKQLIYGRQSWFLRTHVLDDAGLHYEHFSNNAFLRDLARNAMVDLKAPIYKFVHLITPHPPLVADSDCTYSKKVLPLTRENFEKQAACSLMNVVAFLDKLKQLQIYDSSLIIINADHGADLPFKHGNSYEWIPVTNAADTIQVGGAPLALLLIKPPQAKGGLQVSDAQVELTDLPATVNKLLDLGVNFSGESAFDVDPKVPRVRRYFGGGSDGDIAFIRDYFDRLQELRIQGSIFDQSSWQIGAKYYSPLLTNLPKYQWNALLSFDERSGIKNYFGRGWGIPEEKYTWTDGDKASLRIPVDKPDSDIKLTVKLHAFLVPGKLVRQRVRVWANGKHVGDWDLQSKGFHDESAVIPRQAFEGDADYLNLTFDLPDAAVPKNLGAGDDVRTLALAIQSLRLAK